MYKCVSRNKYTTLVEDIHRREGNKGNITLLLNSSVTLKMFLKFFSKLF